MWVTDVNGRPASHRYRGRKSAERSAPTTFPYTVSRERRTDNHDTTEIAKPLAAVRGRLDDGRKPSLDMRLTPMEKTEKEIDIAAEVRRLAKMTVPELRAQHQKHFGEELRSRHRQRPGELCGGVQGGPPDAVAP